MPAVETGTCSEVNATKQVCTPGETNCADDGTFCNGDTAKKGCQATADKECDPTADGCSDTGVHCINSPSGAPVVQWKKTVEDCWV